MPMMHDKRIIEKIWEDFPLEAELTRYRRLPKIDTPKIDTFYEISRNFEKIK